MSSNRRTISTSLHFRTWPQTWLILASITYSSDCFWSVCYVFHRHYLESRSLNQRLDSRDGHTRDHSLDMACEDDNREGTCKDRDRDWHHYSKSSGRSGRSGRSRRSSRRHRDRKRRHSHSRHRSSSVREHPSLLFLFCPVNRTDYRGCLANA